MTRLTARSSTIFIATSGDTRVFRSLDEIPPALRRKLQQSTHGLNSATILIADERGRQELLRALEPSQNHVASFIVETLRSRQSAAPEASLPPKRRILFSWRRWLEVLLPAARGAALWFFIDSHF